MSAEALLADPDAIRPDRVRTAPVIIAPVLRTNAKSTQCPRCPLTSLRVHSPLAGIYALAGEKEPAFAWLEKAVETRDPWLSLIKIQPAYDSLRPDPRFAGLLQRVNLTP